MKRTLLTVIVVGLLCLPTSAEARRNNENDRLEVPGGVTSQKRAVMWKAAKVKCYELEYSDITEDKEADTLVCRHDKLAQIMRFDAKGVTIASPTTTFTKLPIVGGMWSKPRNDRRRMRNAMASSIGLPETEQ